MYNGRNNEFIKIDDVLIEGRQIQNEMEKIEGMIRTTKGPHNNITEEEVKKLIGVYLNAYDPRKNDSGKLISNSQTVSQSTNIDIFNDRYKELQKNKINKLSNLLLSKKTNTLIDTDNNLNRILGYKTFDKKVFDRTLERKHKFLNLCAHILSSKGIKIRDTTILRYQRKDKGGVVNLAQKQKNLK